MNGLILIIWQFIDDSHIFHTLWVIDSFVFHKVRKHTLNKTNEVWKALSTLHTEKEACKKGQEQEAAEGKIFLCGKKK